MLKFDQSQENVLKKIAFISEACIAGSRKIYIHACTYYMCMHNKLQPGTFKSVTAGDSGQQNALTLVCFKSNKEKKQKVCMYVRVHETQ